MMIGQRLRQLREEKGLSHVDVERASGLPCCYILRVEHGHTVPSLETLERFAAALKVPLYRLFWAGEGLPDTPHLTPRLSLEELADETFRNGGTFSVEDKGFVRQDERPG
jgi:transcriptional regulator with XRE-family HTH domain